MGKALAFPQKIGKVNNDNDETSLKPHNDKNLLPYYPSVLTTNSTPSPNLTSRKTILNCFARQSPWERGKVAFTLAEGASHGAVSDSHRKIAFTWAEVLITLGIIGVVAAMTLPTLVQNNRNKELQAGLKKAYSQIAQALDLYQAENGERLTPENHIRYRLKQHIIKYFKISKDCGQGSEGTVEALEKTCIPNYRNEGSIEKNSTNYKIFNGTSNIALGNFDDGQFVLIDGMLVLIEDSTAGNLYISVDVNGYRKNPNRLGQDLFMFQIDSKGTLKPMGAEGTTYYSATEDYCSPTSTNSMNGAGCTYKALTDENFFKNLK